MCFDDFDIGDVGFDDIDVDPSGDIGLDNDIDDIDSENGIGVNSHSHDISFGSESDMVRDLAKSELMDELKYKNIFYGSVDSDSYHGGLSSSSGSDIHNAIDRARNNGSISDSTYRELLRMLKQACYWQ